ncbi:putative repeat protein (TIGR03943 family) [Melghirimyces profundicolus]|uniref:Putative repeat protein (TIGR03943 family) n=1 Tax=Melghirimyces profundicolus TaxID=1242148 RepID=A0A2T6BW54_9BACL|nr:TIGR03943 family protein [Melghirimyces profundicolus]PTX60293.1 putative repeat protein (TIGR03943 family) [Melghirimyces profundicolus]
MGAFLRASVCLGTALLLTVLIVTGELRFYVNPRFLPFTAAGVLFLLLLGLVQLWNLRTPALHRTGVIGYLLLLTPLLLFILVRPGALDVSIAANKGVSYLSPEAMQKEQKPLTQKEAEQRKKGESPDKDPGENDEPLSETDPNEYYQRFLEEMKSAPVIDLKDEKYISRLSTIQLYHKKDLKNKRTRIRGFVYRSDDLPEGIVMVSRYTVTCCAADASVVGVFASFPGVEQLGEGIWIEVEGPLKSVRFQNSDMPLVKADGYKRIPAPADPYIYAGF